MCDSVNFQNKRVINGSRTTISKQTYFQLTSRFTQNKSVKCRNPLTKNNDKRYYIIGRRDPNPIGNIVKTNVERRKPKNCKELEQFMTEEWDNIPNTVLINLIDSIKRSM